MDHCDSWVKVGRWQDEAWSSMAERLKRPFLCLDFFLPMTHGAPWVPNFFQAWFKADVTHFIKVLFCFALRYNFSSPQYPRATPSSLLCIMKSVWEPGLHNVKKKGSFITDILGFYNFLWIKYNSTHVLECHLPHPPVHPPQDQRHQPSQHSSNLKLRVFWTLRYFYELILMTCIQIVNKHLLRKSVTFP